MVRIAGIQIPNKKVEYALPYLYGVGHSLARKIVAEVKIDPRKKIEELTPAEVKHVETYIENSVRVGGELRREIQENIKRLTEINAYRGTRHSRRLPVRGQRTKTNARTRKGPKKTVGSGKRKLTKK